MAAGDARCEVADTVKVTTTLSAEMHRRALVLRDASYDIPGSRWSWNRFVMSSVAHMLWHMENGVPLDGGDEWAKKQRAIVRGGKFNTGKREVLRDDREAEMVDMEELPG